MIKRSFGVLFMSLYQTRIYTIVVEICLSIRRYLSKLIDIHENRNEGQKSRNMIMLHFPNSEDFNKATISMSLRINQLHFSQRGMSSTIKIDVLGTTLNYI